MKNVVAENEPLDYSHAREPRVGATYEVFDGFLVSGWKFGPYFP